MMRIRVPYGVACISLLYGAFCLAFLDQGFECDGDCDKYGVENFPIAWGSDFFLGVVLVILASHLMCYRRGLRKGVLALVSQASAYILWGIVRLQFPNDGSVDGKGLRGYYIVNMLAYLLATDSFIEVAGIVVQIHSHVHSNYRPCFFNRSILKFIVAVTVVANLCIAAGSLWCIGSNVTEATNGADIEIPMCVSWIEKGQATFTACAALVWIAAAYGFGAFAKMMAERHGVWYWIWGLPMPLAAAGIVIIQLLVFIFYLMILALTSQSGQQAEGTMASFASIAYHYAELMTAFFAHNLIATLAAPVVYRHHGSNDDYDNKSASSAIFWARGSFYGGSDSEWSSSHPNETDASAVSVLGQADPSKEHSESTLNMDQLSVTSNSTGEMSVSTSSMKETVQLDSRDVEEGKAIPNHPEAYKQPIAMGLSIREESNQSTDTGETSVCDAVVDTLGLEWASQVVFSFLETVENQTQALLDTLSDDKVPAKAHVNELVTAPGKESLDIVTAAPNDMRNYPQHSNDIENLKQDRDNPNNDGKVCETLEVAEASVAALTSRLRDEKINDLKPTSPASKDQGNFALHYVGEEIVMTFETDEEVKTEQESTQSMENVYVQEADNCANNVDSAIGEERSEADETTNDANETLNSESSHSSFARIDMLGLVEQIGIDGLTNCACDAQREEIFHERLFQASECENGRFGQKDTLQMVGGTRTRVKEALRSEVECDSMSPGSSEAGSLQLGDAVLAARVSDETCETGNLPNNALHAAGESMENATEEDIITPAPIVDEEHDCLESQPLGTVPVILPTAVTGMWDFLSLATPQRLECRSSHVNSTLRCDPALSSAPSTQEQCGVTDDGHDHHPMLDWAVSQTPGSAAITPITNAGMWDLLTPTFQHTDSGTSNEKATELEVRSEDSDESPIANCYR